MSQTEKEIYAILNKGVFFVRESTDKEKELFPDKKEGGFFTFALESGQKFVANFSEEGIGRKKNRIMTFRPLNKMIKGLEEFSWIEPTSIFTFRDAEAEYKFSADVSDKFKEIIMDFFEPERPGDLMGSVNCPMMDKALQVSYAYFSNLKTKKKLEKSLIPEIQRKQKTR